MGEPFDELMSMLDSPVFVVTTQVDGQPSGCLVNFATQVGVRPPRFIIAIAKTSRACAVANRATHLAVHMLSQGQHGLAELFDDQTGDETTKFARCSWRGGPQGMPVLDDAAAWFVGRTLDRADFGDHIGYLLEPAGVWAPENPEDFLYLSDLDDEDSRGDEEPQRFLDREPVEQPRRYGVPRFTLDRF